MDSAMGSVGMDNVGGLALFLSGWAAMMVAMMLPATLPLILLYRTIARKPQEPVQVTVGMAALLLGYIGVWTAAGLPVYAYNVAAGGMRSVTVVLPALLLVAGGVYQFAALKRGCHARCSNPLFFMMHKWRPGAAGGCGWAYCTASIAWAAALD